MSAGAPIDVTKIQSTTSTPRVLAIEASTHSGGVAIVEPGLLRASVNFTTGTLYSQRLLPSLNWLLERCGLQLTDMSGIAVAIGPGSFTGLRIGLSAAKGLAYAAGLPLVGIGTMEALAVRASSAAPGLPVCTLLDARQGEVFAGLFNVSGSGAEISVTRRHTDHAGSIAAISDWISTPTIFAGDAALKFEAQLRELYGDKFFAGHPLRNLPNAEEVGLLGMQRLARGEQDDLMLLEPDYLRRSYMQK